MATDVLDPITLSELADALRSASFILVISGVLVGALSIRTWDFIRDLHYQWRAFRRLAARRRRQYQALRKFLKESRA